MELLPNKLQQLCFFRFYPAGLFAFSGEPASPRGGSDTWWLPSERQQVAAAAAAERSSLPKIRQRGPSGTARHAATRQSVDTAALCLGAGNFSRLRHVALFNFVGGTSSDLKRRLVSTSLLALRRQELVIIT